MVTICCNKNLLIMKQTVVMMFCYYSELVSPTHFYHNYFSCICVHKDYKAWGVDIFLF